MSELFAQYGEVVSCALPNDRETGRPRGFGFVEMSADDAKKAIQALDGKDFGGRALRVNEAQPREARSGGGGGYGGGGGGGGAARGNRPLFKTTCAGCGGEAEVPFEPKRDRPVYCYNCFKKQRDSGGGGRY